MQSKQVLLTPDQCVEKARDIMLDGREPETEMDYLLLVNGIASNIDPDIAVNACLLMRAIYKWPLTAEQVEYIAARQADATRKERDDA